MQHTPILWINVGRNQIGRHGSNAVIATTHDGVSGDYSAESGPNAEFIIRAVNNYEQFLAALKEVKELATGEWAAPPGLVSRLRFADIITRVNAAIKQAKEEE